LRKIIPANTPPGSAADFTIHDPLELTPKTLDVSQAELHLMRLFDGTRNMEEVVSAYADRHGSEMDLGRVAALARRLEDNLMLEDDRSRRAAEEATDAYRAAPLRLMRHTECYAADSSAMTAMVSSHLAHEDGPVAEKGPAVTGLFAPHIDISIAGPCYASAYAAASADADRDLFVILATAHFRDTNLFILTEKDFQTPHGTVEVDREFTSELKSRFGGDLFRDELIHKTEHSVEFQVVYLNALLHERRPFRIVPILVSSFATFIEAERTPSEDPYVGDFLKALAATIESRKERVCIVAGVDMAHVGLKFGDPNPPDEQMLADLKEADMRSLDFAARANPEGFWENLTADGNARKVCGLAPMYVSLHMLKGSKGEVVSYGRDFQPEQGFAVTYAGMVFRP
jgi:AmmeMemoRadiSam system protein B